MNFFINNSNIQVTNIVDGVSTKLGSIQDSCCNTNVIVKGVSQPLIFENAPGKGGFISKKLFIQDLIDAFKTVYKSEELKQKLNKLPITIKRIELENGSYKSRLG